MGLVLVTPVKDEAENLPKLFESIRNLSLKPKVWVILNNESSDNSPELLRYFKEEAIEIEVDVVDYVDPVEQYQLGFKYSRIIRFGFDHVLKNYDFDFIGILDADVFPEPNYYEALIDSLNNDSAMGMTSGVCYDFNGKFDGERVTAVRGNCKIWTKECFMDAGYIVGPSADTLSLALAEINGWNPRANPEVQCNIRPMGLRAKWGYYGFSASYRGIPFYIALTKMLRIAIYNKPISGIQYIKGYYKNKFGTKEFIDDSRLWEHFQKVSMNRLLTYVKGIFRR